MPEEVYEFFATLGYIGTLAKLQEKDMIDGGPLEAPKMRIAYNGDQIVVGVKDIDRRAVYDDDFGWLWYNAEGPEE